MKKQENKCILYGMDAVIVVLVLLCFMEVFVMTSNWLERNGTQMNTNKMLEWVLNEDYTKTLYYTHRDEPKNVKVNGDLQEVYALSHYFEGAFYERVYREEMNQTEGEAYEKAAQKVSYYEQLQERSLEKMGELAPVKEKIDRVVAGEEIYRK